MNICGLFLLKHVYSAETIGSLYMFVASFLCCKSIYPEAETLNKYRICVRSTIILMIVMIIKRYSMRSFKDNYSGISAQFKKLEAV